MTSHLNKLNPIRPFIPQDEYLFDFNNTFEIHDDMEVLKRMGLSLGLERGQVSAENLAKAQSMVPKALEQYVTQLAENGPGELVVVLILASLQP